MSSSLSNAPAPAVAPAAQRPSRSRAARTSADSPRGLILLFIGLILAMLLASLNQTVLSTALPTMVGELNGVGQMTWIITAYILAATVVLPIYGKIGDLIGRKSLLLAAILIFMAGSVIGALAGDITWLIAGRAVQGIGGGGLMILSQAIIADVVPARERGKYMGYMGAVFAVSSVAGPLLGGWITEVPGWRWAFWMNLPLGAIALIAGFFFLKLPRRINAVRPRIDYGGMMLLSAGTTALVLVATWGGDTYDWGSPQILGLIGAVVVSALLLVIVERRVSEPIMPLYLFKDRNFNLTTAAGLLTGVAMFGVIGYLPMYLQMATGASATEAGLLMIPMMASMLLTSVVSGVYVSRTGRYKWVPIAGSVLLGISLLLLSTVTVSTSLVLTCTYLGMMGLALGSSMQLLVLIVQNSFPARVVGTATAANNFFRQIGASLGSAVVGSLFASRLLTLLSDRVSPNALGGGGATSLTPAAVNALPPEVHAIVVEAYNEALMPIALYMIPLALLAVALLSFVYEKPLSTTIERDYDDTDTAVANVAARAAQA